MSYSKRDLWREIDARLEALLEVGRPIDLIWLTNAICEAHAPDEFDFWRLLAWHFVRDAVRRRAPGRIGKEHAFDDRQLSLFDSYKHLPAHCTIERDGKSLVVPITQMSDSEIALRAAKIRKGGESAIARADDMDRYRKTRTPELAMVVEPPELELAEAKPIFAWQRRKDIDD